MVTGLYPFPKDVLPVLLSRRLFLALYCFHHSGSRPCLTGVSSLPYARPFLRAGSRSGSHQDGLGRRLHARDPSNEAHQHANHPGMLAPLRLRSDAETLAWFSSDIW